jgi:NADH pyrophosphatase NudC (nudix superfamily)
VTFFLMRYLSGDTANHDHEVDEARWFDISQARRSLKYVNEKRLIDMALEYLAANPAAFGDLPIVTRTAEQATN